PLASEIPASTPAWNAWPVRPPAPRTSPIEDIGSFCSPAVVVRCLPPEVLGGETRIDGDEQSLRLRRPHAVDGELAAADDAPALHAFDAAVQLDPPVHRCRLEVADGESAGHARVTRGDVGHAEE